MRCPLRTRHPLRSTLLTAAAIWSGRAAGLRSQPPIRSHQPRADLATRLHVIHQNVGAAGAPFRNLMLGQADDLHALLACDRTKLTLAFGGPLPDPEFEPLDRFHDGAPMGCGERLP